MESGSGECDLRLWYVLVSELYGCTHFGGLLMKSFFVWFGFKRVLIDQSME